ncbi:unnamed protein product [Darwinula stevensoni]|uniref:Coiled-coil domain-containing protein n=1 Tax=Darwinula stevensoni TaxID=69355 RepID=A0A7R9A2U1_9CRUS|nr:unnamed protein product [Darwinula stevensoni]CAG0880195.1 unnamed protein product [Darwinula stevensoni]
MLKVMASKGKDTGRLCNIDSYPQRGAGISQRNALEASLPRAGLVNKVCREFLVLEDGALAYKLQNEEISQHYQGNKERNAVLRTDAPKAREEQKKEEEEAERIQCLYARMLQAQEEEDARLAAELQRQLLCEDREVMLGALSRDAQLAKALQHSDAEEEEEEELERRRKIYVNRPERRYYEEEDLDPFDGIVSVPEDEEDIEEGEYEDEEERARRIQELQDEALARRLQEEEEVEATGDRRLAMEQQDRELAKLLYREERAKLKRAKERTKQKKLREMKMKEEEGRKNMKTLEQVAASLESHLQERRGGTEEEEIEGSQVGECSDLGIPVLDHPLPSSRWAIIILPTLNPTKWHADLQAHHFLFHRDGERLGKEREHNVALVIDPTIHRGREQVSRSRSESGSESHNGSGGRAPGPLMAPIQGRHRRRSGESDKHKSKKTKEKKDSSCKQQ